jgi:hypothetical protein
MGEASMLTIGEAKKATCPVCVARLGECPLAANGVVLAHLRFDVLAGVGVQDEHAMFVTTVGKIALCAADRVKGESPGPAAAGEPVR